MLENKTEQIIKLKALLEQHRIDDQANRCLAALSDEIVNILVAGAPVSSEKIYNIYRGRSMRNGPTGSIQGYATLIPALKKKAQSAGVVRLYCVGVASEWFVVFADEEAISLFGVLSEKSDRVFRRARRME